VFAQTPTVKVVHTTAAACDAWNVIMLGTGSCRQSVVVIVESSNPTDTFLVGIRYLTADGVETIQSRYPVAAGNVSFYIDDIRMLSATAGSLKSNQVGMWLSGAH
jgi:hypothetical protein